jgi:hypothetical protein
MNGRGAAIAAAAPIAASMTGVVTALVWAPVLPGRIAEQWNNTGVSSTTSVPGIILYLVVSGCAISAIGAVAVARTASRQAAAMSGGIAIALSLFITGSLMGLMAAHRNIDNPYAVTGPPMDWIGASAVVALVAGVVGARAITRALPKSSIHTSCS